MSLVMQPNHAIGPKQIQTLTNNPERAVFPVFYLIYCPFKYTKTNQLAQWKHSMTNVQQRSPRSNELQLLKAFKNTDVLPHLQPIWTIVVLLTKENEKYFFFSKKYTKCDGDS